MDIYVYEYITGLKICHWEQLPADTQQSSRELFFFLLSI